ncbi:hypothetical protein KZ810_07855 [Sphingomonas sp. RHCKR47]|uniref:hypothetical protein n=1 Tax=Sphingomonas citricola TaxID=2862498 RepID=UPI001CA51AEF|nr:hypothetical protein [Sphingomonas citricola]MBW6523410.1 hypothetical protein [Sphingomonas citricola]
MTDSPLSPEALATWTDEQVRTFWVSSNWELGHADGAAIAVEMMRRNLSFGSVGDEDFAAGSDILAGRIMTAPGGAWAAFAVVIAVVAITAIYLTRRVFG